VGCSSGSATWLRPLEAGALWWTSTREKAVQIAARRASAPDSTRTGWSELFQVREERIGAYPTALKSGQSCPYLVCVCIDHDGVVLSITVRGERNCHTLANQHPKLQVDAVMEACIVRHLNDRKISWIPFGDHPLNLEQYREDEHGPCARMTRTNREV